MSIEHLGLNVVYQRPNVLIISEMIKDIKKLNNPLYPIPEKVGIAKAWAHFICRFMTKCVDPDEVDITRPETVRRLIDLMIEYISNELRGRGRGRL